MSQEDLSSPVKELSIQESPAVETVDENDKVEDVMDTNQEQLQTDENAAPEVEVEVVEEDEENGEGEEDDDDDDFGAFSDASFDEFESRPEPQEVPSTTTETNSTTYTQLPQSLFNSPSDLQETLNNLLSQSFPGTLPRSSVPQNTDVLNERSKLLLERLTALPYLKPHNWKKSSLRRQLLITLGIPDTESVVTRRKNLDDGMQYKIVSFEDLGMSEQDAEKFKVKNDEIIENLEQSIKDDHVLQSLNDDGLDGVIKDYESKVEEISKLLAVWEYEEKKLENDNSTFEGVVENLVGHTQRLRREETLKSLKKEAQKSKGIGSMFKKKSKK